MPVWNTAGDRDGGDGGPAGGHRAEHSPADPYPTPRTGSTEGSRGEGVPGPGRFPRSLSFPHRRLSRAAPRHLAAGPGPGRTHRLPPRRRPRRPRRGGRAAPSRPAAPAGPWRRHVRSADSAAGTERGSAAAAAGGSGAGQHRDRPWGGAAAPGARGPGAPRGGNGRERAASQGPTGDARGTAGDAAAGEHGSELGVRAPCGVGSHVGHRDRVSPSKQ